ncbi:hypothetical protein K3495_g6387 [Podosphaera aphanis]|nr:hypothetical protein K3495_g6387 [Podosphaera aphanis]
MTTRSGREVKKRDYECPHCGKAAQVSSDPKTWNEAMNIPEALQWKRATVEEFRSLKEKCAVKIIPHLDRPKPCPAPSPAIARAGDLHHESMNV